MERIVSPEQMHQFTRFKIYFNLMNNMVYIKGVIKKLPIFVLFSSYVNVIKILTQNGLSSVWGVRFRVAFGVVSSGYFNPPPPPTIVVGITNWFILVQITRILESKLG